MTPHPYKSKSLPFPVAAVDLFCGAGGLTRGLLSAGIPVVAGYDIDGACKYAYEHNNAPAVFKQESVAALDGEQLSAHFPKDSVRVLVGCAPCAPFSKYTQGQKPGEDAKWGLLAEFGRLVRELQPDIISMENVPELQRHSVFDDFLATLTDEHFFFSDDKEKRVVFCPDYGIPQYRRRLVVVASRFGPIDLIGPTHKPSKYRKASDAIGDLPPLACGEISANDPLHRTSKLSALNLQRIQSSTPGGSWREWPEELVAECHRQKSGKSYPSVYGRMKAEEPSPTITTQFYGFGNGRFGHWKQNRALSLREGAILQSFPRSYEFVKPGGEYEFKVIGRMIGNAVPVRLGKIVGMTIARHLKDLAKTLERESRSTAGSDQARCS